MTINKENLDIAITVMERVREQSMPLDMGAWQDCEPREIVREEKHLCGTPCCFAGYIAVSPEFKMVGKVSVGGAPMFNCFLGDDAIKAWLEISEEQAEALTCLRNKYLAYGNLKKDYIQAEDVLKALYSLRDTGKLPFED